MPYTTWSSDVAASQAGTVNTDLDGLAIGEGCAPGSMNAMGRMLMANMRNLSNTVPDATLLMPKTGGAFTGDITRNGGGGYAYNASATFVGGKITIQALGGAAPSSPQEGDQWIEY